jgi:hypothetical protein
MNTMPHDDLEMEDAVIDGDSTDEGGVSLGVLVATEWTDDDEDPPVEGCTDALEALDRMWVPAYDHASRVITRLAGDGL